MVIQQYASTHEKIKYGSTKFLVLEVLSAPLISKIDFKLAESTETKNYVTINLIP